jgi:hypothetical protein
MTEIRADISIGNDGDASNLLQRLGQIRDEIDTISNHQDALEEMGYSLSLGETKDGELLVEIADLKK